MPPPAVLGIPGIVKVAVGLCKALAEDNDEVLGFCKSAQQLGDCDEACLAAVEGLARAAHEAVRELVPQGSRLPKPQAARAERVAREAHTLLAPRGPPDEALALGLLADAQLSRGEAGRALATARRALELLRGDARGDRSTEARLLSTLLGANLAQGLVGVDPRLEVSSRRDAAVEALKQQADAALERALDAGQELVDLLQTDGELEAEARTLARLSAVHAAKGETDEAKLVAREARSLYEDLDDLEGQAGAARAVVTACMGAPEDADQALVAAEDLVQFLRNKQFGSQDAKRLLGDALILLARAQFQVPGPGQAELALASAREAETILKNAGTKAASLLAGALQVCAQLLAHTKDSQAATKAAQQAAEVAAAAGDRAAQAGALQLAASLQLEMLLKEVEADPKSFSKAHNDRLEEAWAPMHEALLIYQELRQARGEAEVSRQVQQYLERAKNINEKVATPVKTTVYIDPVTRKVREEHVYHADVQTQPAVAAG